MPNRLSAPMWLTASVSSFAAAAILILLAYRIVLPGSPIPGGLVGFALLPPRDFPGYPAVTLVLRAGSFGWGSPRTVLAVQAGLFAVGFLHVQWIMGMIPVKIDPRVFETALIAHAIAWSSALCGVAALVAGRRSSREIRAPGGSS